MQKFIESDWLRAMQFTVNTVQKWGHIMQKVESWKVTATDMLQLSVLTYILHVTTQEKVPQS